LLVQVGVFEDFEAVDLLRVERCAERPGFVVVEEFDVGDDVFAREFFFAGRHDCHGVFDEGGAELACAACEGPGAGPVLGAGVAVDVEHLELHAGVWVFACGPCGDEIDVPERVGCGIAALLT
jgi:hypothetical protein